MLNALPGAQTFLEPFLASKHCLISDWCRLQSWTPSGLRGLGGCPSRSGAAFARGCPLPRRCRGSIPPCAAAPGPDCDQRHPGPPCAVGDACRDCGETKPRNPRHFDGIEGGRKRVSDTFTHKNNGSEEHNHCFMHHFGVKTLSETLFPPPLKKPGYGARRKLSPRVQRTRTTR